MGVTLAVLALVAGGVVVGAIYAVNAARRGVAASLVGEIAEILNVIETHDVENGSTNSGRCCFASAVAILANHISISGRSNWFARRPSRASHRVLLCVGARFE